MRGREARGKLEMWAGSGHAGFGGPLEGFGSSPKLRGKPLKDINKGGGIIRIAFFKCHTISR